jgi:TldD protein
MRSWSRRAFVQRLGVVGVGASAVRLVRPRIGARPYTSLRNCQAGEGALDPAIIINGTDVRALAMRALDAAKSAGASYVDVRLTRRLDQEYSGEGVRGALPFDGESEAYAVGVRAMVNGVWGFAASPYWDAADVVQLGRDAARQATTNAQATAHANAAGAPAGSETWTRIPGAVGAWATPITSDPFVVTVEEKGDLLATWGALADQYRKCTCKFSASFGREERAVATTEGAYFTQTLYQSGGTFTLHRQTTSGKQRFGQAFAHGLVQTAAGWELFAEADIPGQMPQLYELADPRRAHTAEKPGDVGRYDVVCDAATMAALVDATIGTAAQVDVARGDEANAGGVSYLGPDLLALLGSFQTAAPFVTVTANRSMRRGLATVKWDDEGVVPEDFTLVKNGVLVDYQTNREQAEVLASWYQQQGTDVRSHGCAAAGSALDVTMTHSANLVLEPGTQADVTFDTLVRETKKGLALTAGGVRTDFQSRTGIMRGQLQEIVNGQLGAIVGGLVSSFNTIQLWNNVVAVGGAGSAVTVPSRDTKGEPAQSTWHSVRAVPAKIRNADFIDPWRKA